MSRHPRLRRALWIALAGLAALVVAVLAGAAFLVGTEKGTRWLVARAGALAPGELTIGALTGTLGGPLAARKIAYRSATLEIEIERLELEWHLAGILRRHVRVDRLLAAGVAVTTRAPPEENAAGPEPLPDVRLPLALVVRAAEVRDLVVAGAGDEPPTRIAAIRFAGRASGSTVAIERLELEAEGLRAALSGTLEPQGDYPLDLETRAMIALADRPPLVLAGRLHGDLGKLTVEQEAADPWRARLDATLLEPLDRLELEATLRLAGLDSRTIDGEWPAAELAGTVTARGALDRLSARGRFELAAAEQGSIAARFDGVWQPAGWSGEVTANVAPATGPEVPLRLTLAGTADRLEVERLAAELLGGTLHGGGSVRWQPQLAWSAALEARGLDPGELAAEYGGELDLTLTSDGTVADADANAASGAGIFGRVRLDRVEGRLRGRPLVARAELLLAGERRTLERLDLRWGDARLEAAGAVLGPWDLDVRLTVPELASLLPEAAGSLRARGRVRGSPERPRIAAELAGRELRWGELAAERLDGTVEAGLDPGAPLEIDLTALTMELAGRRIERLRLGSTGELGAHRWSVEVAGADDRLELGARGGYAGATWRGELTRLSLDSRRAGEWRLAAPVALEAGAELAALERFCWRSGDGAELCAGGSWRSAGSWLAEARLRDLPLTLVEPLLPPELRLAGRLEGRVRARAAAGGLLADLELDAHGLELTVPAFDGEPLRRSFEPARLTAVAAEGGTEGELRLGLPGAGHATARLRLPGFAAAAMPTADQPVEGRLELAIDDLGALAAFLPELERIEGTLRGGFDVAGTVGRPQPTGELVLRDGKAALPLAGIELAEVGIEARADGGAGFALSGSARSGGGELELRGRAALVLSAETPLELAITARRFLAVDTETARVFADADLRFVHRGEIAELDGEVMIPEAEIVVAELEPTAVEPSRDVVFVGAQRPEAETVEPPFALRARVVLTLGDEVEVAALGFEGEPRGTLTLIERPGRPTTATGEIRFVSGTYQAYGQDLALERGSRLVFAGPVDEPAIDARASRTAADGTVAGVAISGTARRPVLELWSEPPMGDSDRLSYLLLGRPLDRASEGDGDLLARAATSLGLKGGNLLAESLGARFGLEEAYIETGGGLDEAALVLGRQLSPRLYVSYGVGLFEPSTTLRARYRLGEHWTLRAESGGEATGADLLYTVERGGAKRAEDPPGAASASSSGGPR